MRVVGRLHETVAQHSNLIHLEGVLGHHLQQVWQTILQEVELSLLRVSIEKLIRDDCQSFYHKVQQVESLWGAFWVAWAFRCQSGVDFLESLSEEVKKLWEIRHLLCQDLYDILHLVLQG